MKNLRKQSLEQKLNSIRAGVLGSNDGILTVVGVIFSTAAASQSSHFVIFIAALSDLLACCTSMAAGEYASVSAQKESQKVVVRREKKNIKHKKNYSFFIISKHYLNLGVEKSTAKKIALTLSKKNELESVVSDKYAFKIGQYIDPWYAAISSLFSAALGGLFPLLAIIILPVSFRIIGTILFTSVALIITGILSALIGKGYIKPALIRNVVIGLITVAIHYGIGKLF